MTEIQMLPYRYHLPPSTMVIGKKIDQQTQSGSGHARKATEERRDWFPNYFVNKITNWSFICISTFPQVLVPTLPNTAFTTTPAKHAEIFSQVCDHHFMTQGKTYSAQTQLPIHFSEELSGISYGNFLYFSHTFISSPTDHSCKNPLTPMSLSQASFLVSWAEDTMTMF